MVNHARTLLLNKTSYDIAESGCDCWYIDPSFACVSPTGALSSMLSLLFSDAESVEDKVARIDRVMPFLLDPEFDAYFSSFDTRVTVESDTRPVETGTVYKFYRTMAGLPIPVVDSIIKSLDAPLLFNHTGDAQVDSMLDSLYRIFSNGFESSKKFSAVVWSMVIHLDYLNRKATR